MRYDKDTKVKAVRRAIHQGVRNAAWYMDIRMKCTPCQGQLFKTGQ